MQDSWHILAASICNQTSQDFFIVTGNFIDQVIESSWILYFPPSHHNKVIGRTVHGHHAQFYEPELHQMADDLA